MKQEDVKAMTEDQLHSKLAELKKEGLNLRFQKVTGALENTARIKEVRRAVARILTCLNEKRVSNA